MTHGITPAQVFHPGIFIREELEVRGWTQADLAEIMGRSIAEVSRIVNAKTGITDETAQQLGEAFETGPEYWLNLQSAYSIATLPPNALISEKAKVFNYAPIREMRRRGWIRDTDDVGELKAELFRFFKVSSLDEPRPFAAAARKYDPSADPTSTQSAWLARAYEVASELNVAPFDHANLPNLEAKLRSLAASPASASQIQDVFSSFGIRFVIIEPLQGGKIDGAAFWLDSGCKTDPAIAVSFRFDRIDAFWFTTAHEYAHIFYRHGNSFDNDLAGHDQIHFAAKDEAEQAADKKAAELLLPQAEIESFIRRTSPYYSKAKIAKFANRLKVHPGLVVGRLQYMGEIPWTHHKQDLMQGQYRNLVLKGTKLVDGWGFLARDLHHSNGDDA